MFWKLCIFGLCVCIFVIFGGVEGEIFDWVFGEMFCFV